VVPEELLIASGANTLLALDPTHVVAVRNVPQVTRIPHASPAVLGVFHHEGRIAALVDLHRLAAAPEAPPTRPVVLVLRHGKGHLGLVVERVHDVIRFAGTAAPPASSLPSGLAALVTARLAATPGTATSRAPPAPRVEEERLLGVLRDAPDWLARIHDADPTARLLAELERARSILARGDVHLLSIARTWNAVARGEPRGVLP
jgi:chemotaxis signal transduction protein